jgi:integrase
MQPTGEVGVTYGIENGQLWVQIFSTKFEKEENGQVVRGLEWRKIYLNKEYSKANEELYAFVENSAQVELAIHYNADTLRRQVNRLGKKYLISKGILPTRELSISPYSLRHEVASDLKSAEGVSSRDIAAVLGHLSEKSASRYGRKRRGKKTPIKPIIRVECHPEPKADLRIGTRPFDKSAANPNQSKQTGPGF